MIITEWYRLNKNTNEFEFNHISDGFDESVVEPKPMSKTQETAWKGATWKPEKSVLAPILKRKDE